MNACYQTGQSLSPPMDLTSARGHALTEAQPCSERPPHHHQAEQISPDRLPYHSQGGLYGPLESCDMDYIDIHRHQYKYHRHHYYHHPHIQQQPLQHHHSQPLYIAGGYGDLGCNAAEATPVSCDLTPYIETEKQVQPQNQYIDHSGCAIVQPLYKPCEDGYVPVQTHEDFLVLPERHERLHFSHDQRYSQHQLCSPTTVSTLNVPRIRLLCSIGGRIMSRPVDGKLRYCGGDTHIISVDQGVCFSDFIGKLSRMYCCTFNLKYQLPGEDLDALVSVSSDDDLQIMLDEYDKMVASGGNSWFRLFLLRSPSDCEILSHLHFGHGREIYCNQIMQSYINAINGFVSKGASECDFGASLKDFHLSSRMASDLSHTTLAGPFPTKAFSRVSSAPSSIPTSPSVAARTAHHQCCTGDACFQISKDQQSFVTRQNGLEVKTQELSQDQHVTIFSSDTQQSRILMESSRGQQDPSFLRGDALCVKENGTYFVEPEDAWLHQYDRHDTTLLDSRHDVSQPFGLNEPRCEAYSGDHPGVQPSTSLACHGVQVGGEFSRVESVQDCYADGHRQMPFLHHLHQAGSPLHGEALARLQQGTGIGSTCQTMDGRGLLQHINLQNTNVISTLPKKALGSGPSSPRNVYIGSCCSQQHSQVDRGLSVSFGEHPHSKKPSYLGDHTIRRHGLPLLSRFRDKSNLYSDSVPSYFLPILEKGLELDEREHNACLRKHSHSRMDTCVKRCANENAVHSFTEPAHGFHEGSLNHCLSCFADVYCSKGKHLEKAKVCANPEFQVYKGQNDFYRENFEENIIAGRLMHEFKADLNLERGNDSVMGLNYSNGQSDLETRMPSMVDGPDSSGYVCMHASNTFSSTDAVAGSLSRHPLEPPVWVGSTPHPVHGDQLKEREVHDCTPTVDLVASSRQLVDGTVNRENSGDTCSSPSFGRLDSCARVRSISPFANAGELRLEDSPVFSLTHVPEDKIRISFAHDSHPKFDQFCSVSVAQPSAVKTFDPDAVMGSPSLALPIYDQSPVSSMNHATFSFAQSEQKNVSIEREATEQCVISKGTFTEPQQNNGQHQVMAKIDVDAATYRNFEQETMPVLEDSRALSRPPEQCSVDSGVHVKESIPAETVPAAQCRMTNQIVLEVDVSRSVCCGIEEEEKELPATQAEAEAIARGLQIIKNDDLEDLKELGSGTYGTVFHGKWRGSDVAIKRIKASCFMGSPVERERLISDFWREAGTLSQLHHPNIVAFYGVVPDGPEGTLATVTEYMVNGSLKQVLLKKDRTIDRKKRLLIAMDAAFGMEYLHSKRIVHFDMKSENLLVNMRDAHRPICKVGDFGLSKVKHQTLVSGGVRGTLPWMAPELLNTKGMVTEKVDVYSFGIVMWELLTGEEPYANMHCGTIIGGIVNNNLRPVIPSWCDPSWRDLMERCWTGNPADRPDFSSVASELRAIASSMNVK